MAVEMDLKLKHQFKLVMSFHYNIVNPDLYMLFYGFV